MKRVYVVVEGRTEQSFIRDVLVPVFLPHSVYLDPLILGVPGHKGGRVNYARVRNHVVHLLKQDLSACCSTMLDLYGLGKGFPGTPLPPNLTGVQKAEQIEQAMMQDIIDAVPDLRPDVRFIPYLQLHEFEGLLFSNPTAFANGVGQANLQQGSRRSVMRSQVPKTLMTTRTRRRRSA